MCEQIFKKNVFEYHSAFSNTTLNICERCAVREYYGTKGRAGKKWNKERKLGLYFGEENNNRN